VQLGNEHLVELLSPDVLKSMYDGQLQLHLFGASTVCGHAFRCSVPKALHEHELFSYSRRPSPYNPRFYAADLEAPSDFHFAGKDGSSFFLISFAPIWLLSPFLEQLATDFPHRLHNLHGVIACSSSSAVTKRFSANLFDRKLVSRLIDAEDRLLDTCRRLQVSCRILQPTLIYGRIGPYSDRNLSRLLQLMRRLPCLPLPSETGLRQPIHASQVAAVALHLALQLKSGLASALPERIAIGGDTTLTYTAMIRALQQAQPVGDPARRCRLLSIPNRLFFSLAAPLLLRSPKAFEAVLRMGANLSGFTPAHQLLGLQPQPFPVLPLA
jgi:hypothetical protein